MRWTLALDEIDERNRNAIGGKGFALAQMAKSGFRVPPALCITTAANREYLMAAGLRERILMEFHRKEFRERRWEEVWDAALRIRNLFLNHSLPESLYYHLHQDLLVTVRVLSSAATLMNRAGP